jgi:drug/metabolite transporter (DMT)-like permease
MNKRQLGIIQTIASGVCFGFLGLFGKWLYENNVKPGELLALRFLLAAAISFVFILLRFPKRLDLSLKEWLRCALLGVFGYALFSFCFFSALKGLSASLTVLLLYTFPVLVAIGGWIFFGEKIPKDHLPAIPLAGAGLLLLVWKDVSIDRAEYLVFGMAAAVFYAIYILVSSRWLKTVDPSVSTPCIQLFAGLTLGSIYLTDLSRTQSIIQQNWLVLSLVAIICSIAAMGLFLAGLQKLKSWEVSILSTTEPLTGVLVAMLLLSEKLSLLQWTGAIFIVSALIWTSRPSAESTESKKSQAL